MTYCRLHLAHHILLNPTLLDSSGVLPPILELGAGTGFLSILLAQLGADVVASDLGDADEDEDMAGERRTPLARLQANVELSESSALHLALAKPIQTPSNVPPA
jgi:tRNA1(Val) A37 N6-methylase TrmN6